MGHLRSAPVKVGHVIVIHVPSKAKLSKVLLCMTSRQILPRKIKKQYSFLPNFPLTPPRTPTPLPFPLCGVRLTSTDDAFTFLPLRELLFTRGNFSNRRRIHGRQIALEERGGAKLHRLSPQMHPQRSPTTSPSRHSSEQKATVPAAMAAKDPRSRLPRSSTGGAQIRA